MLTKIYLSSWIAALSVALALILTGNMTMLAWVGFGFLGFGLVFMGMMGVLPAMVVHAHHHPAEKHSVDVPTPSLRERMRSYKETLTTGQIGVRKPKFP